MNSKEKEAAKRARREAEKARRLAIAQAQVQHDEQSRQARTDQQRDLQQNQDYSPLQNANGEAGLKRLEAVEERITKLETTLTGGTKSDDPWKVRQVLAAIGSFCVALVALCFSAASAYFAFHSSNSAALSADNSKRSADSAEDNLEIQKRKVSVDLSINVDPQTNVLRIVNKAGPAKIESMTIFYNLVRGGDHSPPTAWQVIKSFPGVGSLPATLAESDTWVIPLHAPRATNGKSVQNVYDSLPEEDRRRGRGNSWVYTKLWDQPIYFDSTGKIRVRPAHPSDAQSSRDHWPPPYSETDERQLLVLMDYSVEFAKIHLRRSDGIEVTRTYKEMQAEGKSELNSLDDLIELAEPKKR